jgi:hypothetical protein
VRHELASLQLEPRPLGWEAVCDCGWSTRYRSRLGVVKRWHDHAVEMLEAQPEQVRS